MPTLPAYPTILTPTDWNNKKGVAAKIVAVPTKIGDSLKEMQEAYNGVDWKVIFDPPTTTLKPMDARLYEVKNSVTNQYGILRDAVKAAKTHATKARDEWSKNKLIPKDSKTHLENLVKTIDTFWSNVESQQKAAYKILTDSREALAKINPKEAAESNTGSQVLIQKDKSAPKSDVIKTKFKPQPAPATTTPKPTTPPPRPTTPAPTNKPPGKP